MQYKNKLNKILPIDSGIKLKLFHNKMIIIENFKLIKDIKDDAIIIDDYFIIGEFLKLTKMDNGRLEINGEIKEILVKQADFK